MLCDYGCGQEAKYITTTNKHCCSERYNSCPALRRKNAAGVAEAHADGRILPPPKETAFGGNPGWAKGILKEKDDTFTYNGKGNHKELLIKERGRECESCHNTEWLNNPIPLELEHVDGDGRNNTKENLKLLCCNCHALTPTWRRRKGIVEGRAKYTDEIMVSVIADSYTMNEALKKLDLKWGSNSTIKRVMKQYNIAFKVREKKEYIPSDNKKNSQSNTHWICNVELQCNKKINKDELEKYLQDGWIKSRVMLFKNMS
jgi:hypothetical protein